MERLGARSIAQRLMVAAAFGVFGTLMWILGSVRRQAAQEVAWARLWPRPDGSVRSYGEVWDHPETLENAT